MQRLLALILLVWGLVSAQPVAAAVSAPTPPPVTVTNAGKTNFVAVTAVGQGGLESDYSVELAIPSGPRQVTIAWDLPTNESVLSWKVYWGTNSRAYKSSQPAITNLATIMLQTNVMVLNLMVSTNTKGPWKVTQPLMRWTNAVGSEFYKLELRTE